MTTRELEEEAEGGCGEEGREGGVREREREGDRDAVAARRLIRRAISTTSSR